MAIVPTALQVSEREISQLDPTQFTQLVRTLLHCEADAHHLPLSAPRVPLAITVADGGEDAHVEWEGGPASTEYLPARTNMLQIKARRMPPSKIRDEMLDENKALKGRIQDVLQEKGAYLIISSRRAKQPELQREEMARIIRNAVGLNKSGLCLAFYDGADVATWANNYPAAALQVRRVLRESVPSGIQTWHDVEAQDDYSTAYQADARLAQYIGEAQASADRGKSVLRISGLSGLGKTRLVLEAFRPSAISGELRASRFLYFDCGATNGGDLSVFVRELADTGRPACIVADNCNWILHEMLVKGISRAKSALSLITVWWEPEDVPPSVRHVALRPDDMRDIVELILKHEHPHLDQWHIRKVCEFAGGFPIIAAKLVGRFAAGEADLSDIEDTQLLLRIVWGPWQAPNALERDVLRACSLFDSVGFDGQMERQARFIAATLCNMSTDVDYARFREICEKFGKRRVVEHVGDFIRVIPIPIAVGFCKEFIDCRSTHDMCVLVDDIAANGLGEHFCRRMAFLTSHPKAKDLTERLVGPGGSFGSAEGLLTPQGSRFFRALVEVDPVTTADAVVRVIGSLSREELLAIDGDIRRNIVWALEALVYWQDTFEMAARLLLHLADAENETWGNNATNQFLHLFQLRLSGTETAAIDRLSVAKYALQSASDGMRLIGVKALGKALEYGDFVGGVGAEARPGRAIAVGWEPVIGRDVLDYWGRALAMLTEIAKEGGSLAQAAKAEISAHLSVLVQHGFVQPLDDALRSVAAASGHLWPEAYNAVDLLLSDTDNADGIAQDS